jgi:PASTA domain-containing protein
VTRLEGWLADRRVRLARSWGAFSHWYWDGRYRLADGFCARQDKLAERFWVRWYRFTDWVGGPWERLAYWYWARRETRADRGSEEAPHGSLPRPSTLTLASIFVVLTLAVALTIRPHIRAPGPTTARSTATRIDAALGVDVPDVRGMSVPEAGAVLERAGLRFERATAAVGMPGQVLGTLPSIGRSVASGTQVTLIVGVQAERIGTSNLPEPFSSGDSSTSP